MKIKSNVVHGLGFMKPRNAKALHLPERIHVVGESILEISDEVYKVFKVAIDKCVKSGQLEIIAGPVLSDAEVAAAAAKKLAAARKFVAEAEAEAEATAAKATKATKAAK